MSNVMRHKRGDAEPVMSVDVDTATVIEIGDLIFQDTSASDVPKPASDIGAIPGTHATLAAAQEAFHDEFLGIALQASRAGDTDPIRVATKGVHRITVASGNYDQGDLIGPNDNAGGTALEDQECIAVATPNLAIGRVVKGGTGVTEVEVAIVSTMIHGGPQAAA